MNIVANTEPRIQDVKVTSDTITAYLVDGRVLSVPLVWSWRLSEATAKQRARFELIGDGQGVHWPDVDEDISVEGMLHGVPAHRPQAGAAPTRDGGTVREGAPNKRMQPTRGHRGSQVGGRGARG